MTRDRFERKTETGPVANSLSRRQVRISLRVIIFMAAITLVAVSIGGVTYLAECRLQKDLTRGAEVRLLVDADHLSRLSTDALSSDTPETILCPRINDLLAQREDLAFSVVLDQRRNIRGHADAGQLGLPFDINGLMAKSTSRRTIDEKAVIYENDDSMAVLAPVMSADNQHLGEVLVGIHKSRFEPLIASDRYKLLSLAVFLLAIAIAARLTYQLLPAIGTLQEGLERIGSGDLDTPLQNNDHTELGCLTDSVNNMMRQLRASQVQMHNKERDIAKTQKELIFTLGEVVEMRSQETAKHIRRVSEFSYMLGYLSGLSDNDANLLRSAAPLHDVGKIAIADHILKKPGTLADDEFVTMKTHTTIGYDILKKSRKEIMRAAATIAHEHHERWDGTGYPRQLSGEDIHIFGRIVSLVDVLDALSTDRVYRKAMPVMQILSTIKAGRGTQFDPRLVDLLFDNLDLFLGHKIVSSGQKTVSDQLAKPTTCHQIAKEPTPA